MKRLKRHVIRLRVRLAGLGAGARFVAGVLAAVVVGGAAWLILAMVSPEAKTVVARGLDRDATLRAEAALDRRGVPCQRTPDGLAVPTRRLSDAKAILKADASGGDSLGANLRSLTDGSSMWRSSAENRRLWQASVMTKLGRLVTEMDPIASASVLFEPGSQGGLGSKFRAARAAVKVTLARGRQMTPSLIVAIGELVSGSVAVEIEDIRVIDQTGRSYRVSPQVQSLAHRHAIESYYGQKIASAIRHIPGLAVDVRIVGARGGAISSAGGPQSGGDDLRVWLSAPRSYFSASGGDETTARRSESLKKTVKSILGPVGNCEVTVSMYGPAERDSAGVSQAGLGWGVLLVAVASFAIAGVLGFWLILRWRSSARRRAGMIDPPQSEESRDELSYDMLGPFSPDAGERRSEDLAREHPQTLALILVRMPSGQAADIMSRLPAGLRSEVARRMGDLDDIDAAVVAEINRDLAGRLKSRPDGSSPQPAEPENVKRRRAERDALTLLAFEDVMGLNAAELRVALGAVEPDDLAISLRMAAKQVRRKVLGCLASKDSEYVRARMDRIGPMRISDVESARQRVMEIVSQAAGAGARSSKPGDQVLEETV